MTCIAVLLFVALAVSANAKSLKNCPFELPTVEFFAYEDWILVEAYYAGHPNTIVFKCNGYPAIDGSFSSKDGRVSSVFSFTGRNKIGDVFYCKVLVTKDDISCESEAVRYTVEELLPDSYEEDGALL